MCTVKRTNVKCDHINKWSKRKWGIWPMKCRGLFSHEQGRWGQWWRSLIRVFAAPLSRPDARQHFLGGTWCILVGHPHLTIIILSRSCLATGMRFGTQNKFVVVSVIMYLIIQAGYSWMDYVWYRESSSVLYQYKKNFWFSNLIDIDSKKTIERCDIINSVSSFYLERYSAKMCRRRETDMIVQVRMRRYHSSLKSLRIKIDEEHNLLYFFGLKLFWICVDITVGFLFVIWNGILNNVQVINMMIVMPISLPDMMQFNLGKNYDT